MLYQILLCASGSFFVEHNRSAETQVETMRDHPLSLIMTLLESFTGRSQWRYGRIHFTIWWCPCGRPQDSNSWVLSHRPQVDPLWDTCIHQLWIQLEVEVRWITSEARSGLRPNQVFFEIIPITQESVHLVGKIMIQDGILAHNCSWCGFCYYLSTKSMAQNYCYEEQNELLV